MAHARQHGSEVGRRSSAEQKRHQQKQAGQHQRQCDGPPERERGVLRRLGQLGQQCGKTGQHQQQSHEQQIDPQALADALERLLRSPDRLSAWGQTGRQRVLERFSAARFDATGHDIVERVERIAQA